MCAGDLAGERDTTASRDAADSVDVAAANARGGSQGDGTGVAGRRGAGVDQGTKGADIRAGGDGLHACDGTRAAVTCTADGERIGRDGLTIEVEHCARSDSEGIGNRTEGCSIAKLEGTQADDGVEGRGAVATSQRQGIRAGLGQGDHATSSDRATIQRHIAVAANRGAGTQGQCPTKAGSCGTAVPQSTAGCTREDRRRRGGGGRNHCATAIEDKITRHTSLTIQIHGRGGIEVVGAAESCGGVLGNSESGGAGNSRDIGTRRNTGP